MQKDTIRIQGSFAVTGLLQTGNENRTVASLLSIIIVGNSKYEIEPLTSIAYSTKPGKQVEGEYLVNIIGRYGQNNMFYPAIGLSVEKSFLKKIGYRYGAGIIVVANLLKQRSQVIKLGLGCYYEITQYTKGAFVPEYIEANKYYKRKTAQFYLRLKGQNHLLANKTVFTYDFFFQPAINDFSDYRWTLISGLDIPIIKKFAFRISAVSSYEAFVATGVFREKLSFFVRSKHLQLDQSVIQ